MKRSSKGHRRNSERAAMRQVSYKLQHVHVFVLNGRRFCNSNIQKEVNNNKKRLLRLRSCGGRIKGFLLRASSSSAWELKTPERRKINSITMLIKRLLISDGEQSEKGGARIRYKKNLLNGPQAFQPTTDSLHYNIHLPYLSKRGLIFKDCSEVT